MVVVFVFVLSLCLFSCGLWAQWVFIVDNTHYVCWFFFGWAFSVVLLLCNGFGWMSIKEGVLSVKEKYQELFKWKQLSIFWAFFLSREMWKFLGSWLWWKGWMPYYENPIILGEVMQIPLHHMPLLGRCNLEAKLGVNDHRYDEVP